MCDVLWCVCALLEGQAVHQPPRGVFGLHFGATQLTSCWRRQRQTWLTSTNLDGEAMSNILKKGLVEA